MRVFFVMLEKTAPSETAAQRICGGLAGAGGRSEALLPPPPPPAAAAAAGADSERRWKPREPSGAGPLEKRVLLILSVELEQVKKA